MLNGSEQTLYGGHFSFSGETGGISLEKYARNARGAVRHTVLDKALVNDVSIINYAICK